MPRAKARIRADAEARLTRLAEPNPDWRPLLGVLRETLLLRDEAVAKLRLECEPATLAPGAPFLQGATLHLAGAWLRDAVRRLAGAAGSAAPEDGHAAALLEAALREDAPALESIARDSGAEPAALATLARYAAIPLLAACATALPRVVTESWQYGYCPLCAAWPLLVELRGLEQARRLRCGRCGTDWRGDWLRCVFCGESNHTRLGSLLSDTALNRCSVATCASCGGYLKTIHTFMPLAFAELLVEDLETVELDLAARARNFVRPPGLGFPLEVRLLLS
jgi:FdhE protein